MHETDPVDTPLSSCKGKGGIPEQVRVCWHSIHQLGSRPGEGRHAHTAFPCHPLGWETWEGSQEAEWGGLSQAVPSPKAWELAVASSHHLHNKSGGTGGASAMGSGSARRQSGCGFALQDPDTPHAPELFLLLWLALHCVLGSCSHLPKPRAGAPLNDKSLFKCYHSHNKSDHASHRLRALKSKYNLYAAGRAEPG